MLQEIIEGKWVDAFERVLALNGIQGGTPVVIVAETQSRPVHMQLAALACHNLGASYSTVVLPTPPQSAPVPVKSTGACNAIQHKRPVIEGLKAAEVIVDVVPTRVVDRMLFDTLFVILVAELYHLSVFSYNR